MRNERCYHLIVTSLLLGFKVLIYAQVFSSNTGATALEFPHTATCGLENELDPTTLGKMMSFTKVHADDVRFTEHVLFDEAAASEEDCALKCTSHEACITFTFTPMTSDGSCYGYEELMGPDHLNLTSPGAKSFAYGKGKLNVTVTFCKANVGIEIHIKGRKFLMRVDTKKCVDVVWLENYKCDQDHDLSPAWLPKLCVSASYTR